MAYVDARTFGDKPTKQMTQAEADALAGVSSTLPSAPAAPAPGQPVGGTSMPAMPSMAPVGAGTSTTVPTAAAMAGLNKVVDIPPATAGPAAMMPGGGGGGDTGAGGGFQMSGFGQLRPLGRRMPPMESSALAAIRKVY